MGHADLINRPAVHFTLSDIGWRLSPDFYTQFADICCYPGPLRGFEKEYARSVLCAEYTQRLMMLKC